MNNSQDLSKWNKPLFVFMAISSIIFLLMKVDYFLLYLALTIIISTIIILFEMRNWQNKQLKHIPLKLSLFLITIILWFFLLSYQIILLLGIIFLFIYAIKPPRKEKSKMLIPIGVILVIFFIVFSDIPSSFVKPAFFLTTTDTTQFIKQPARKDEVFTGFEGFDVSKGVFRSLTFIGIKTDANTAIGIFNYDQANIHIKLNMDITLPDSDSPFWDVSYTGYLIYFEDFVRTQILDSKKSGYDLLDLIENLEPYAQYYKKVFVHSDTLQFEANYVKMGNYLLVVDIICEPNEENKALYTDFELNSFSAPQFIDIHNTMNYGYTVDVIGYAQVLDYMSPRTEAENLFDDLVGNDIWNLAILFIIIFLITVLVALTTRKFDIIKVMNIIMVCVFILGLFATMAYGMDHTPTWLIGLSTSTSVARYIWGVIEAVKYCLVLGTVLSIIFMITMYVESHFEMIMGFTKYEG